MRAGLFTVVALAFTFANAQSHFQTIVTRGPVVLGESFQVQYVLDDTETDSEFFAPDFKGFRVVSGPNIYTGSAYGPSGPRKLKNIVYTLTAISTGRFIVPGASARVENRLYKSNQVWIDVISQQDALNKKKPADPVNEDIFLSPGEDPLAKIRHNLFMKVLVDKTSCVVGEPVTAIFKLYSRLDSKSDIVKNPGFYGFTVQDMINLDSRVRSTEIVNGKNFDVHIVRKVQLYPLQAGHFEIDAMEVKNKVKFSKSAVSGQPEQEIIEGIVPEKENNIGSDAVVFENSMATRPVVITVKPVPEKGKPKNYDGATGNFRITASLQKKELARNEEGELVVSISGKGNFTQLSPPDLQWPQGIDGFDPVIRDSIDHMQTPMSGRREFHYTFISSRPAEYTIPAIDLSFFNPDTNNYFNIHTQPVSLTVTKLESAISKVDQQAAGETRSGNKLWTWALPAVVVIALLAVFFKRYRKNGRHRKADHQPQPALPALPVVSEILQPATVFAGADDKVFYSILRDCIWKYFTRRFDLSGSLINKYSLVTILNNHGIDGESCRAVLEMLTQCETGIFTEATGIGNKQALLQQAKDTLEHINRQVAGAG